MHQRLTAQVARLRAAGRWLVRHRSRVWPPVVVALVIALGAAFIYVVPSQLVHTDSAPTAAERVKMRHDERATLLQSLIGLLALFGAVSALRQLRVTREGQITDRYTKAIDQLDKDKALAVRLGGLYALERIARDSPPDRATIVEVLCAYARTAPRDPPTPTPGTSKPLRRPAAAPPPLLRKRPGVEPIPIPAPQAVPLGVRAPDVQAAITILGRWRVRLRESPDIDLHGAELQGANLRDAQLLKANLAGAHLQGADLSSAQLDGAVLSSALLHGAKLSSAQLHAYLEGAQLQGADLSSAQLQGAYLVGAQLQRANLTGAQLQGAYLSGAQLQQAYLALAQLQEARLDYAQLQGASLSGAQLQEANLSNAQLEGAKLSRAQLQGAYLGGAQVDGTHFTRPESDPPLATEFIGISSAAKADHMTIWPDGFDWKKAGVDLEEG